MYFHRIQYKNSNETAYQVINTFPFELAPLEPLLAGPHLAFFDTHFKECGAVRSTTLSAKTIDYFTGNRRNF